MTMEKFASPVTVLRAQKWQSSENGSNRHIVMTLFRIVMWRIMQQAARESPAAVKLTGDCYCDVSIMLHAILLSQYLEESNGGHQEKVSPPVIPIFCTAFSTPSEAGAGLGARSEIDHHELQCIPMGHS